MSEEENLRQFFMSEYESARARISADIDEINKSEIFYVTVYGLIYFSIFQFKVADKYFLLAMLSLALLVSIYGILRYDAHRSVIKVHEAYIEKEIQPFFLSGNYKESGLVSFYNKNKNKRLKYTRFLFHVFLIIISLIFIAVAIYDHTYVVAITSKGTSP